jgi:hypothetical protein
MQFGTTIQRTVVIASLLLSLAGPSLFASENVPHASFGEWASLPEHGQLISRITYQESEAYYFWAGNTRFKSDFRLRGEHYGIDINQGYISLQYGLNENWAADFAVGYTTVGSRAFSGGKVTSTTGLMDIALGVRYQIFKENEKDCPWIPTLTFRAGAVVPGGFDEGVPFAPGTRSTAIEPELIARKHFGWTGLGAYADGLFRWNHTAANDCYIVAVGFFQQIKNWELQAGYRHLGSINGDSIQYTPDAKGSGTGTIVYPRAVRENQDSFEAGFHYTTGWHSLKLGFQTRSVFDGSNTDKKFWLGCFIEMPFSLVKSK